MTVDRGVRNLSVLPMSHTHKQYLLTIVREFSEKVSIANLFYRSEDRAKKYGADAIGRHKSVLNRKAHYSVMEIDVDTSADIGTVGINSNTPIVDSISNNDNQSN